MATDYLFETVGLHRSFGGVRALQGVDVVVKDGDLVGMIGPNGSGKSTWINCVTGLVKPNRGQVRLRGRDITGQEPHRAYHAGVGRTFQLLENFKEMSLNDNLLLAVQESRGTMAGRLLHFNESKEQERASYLLEFFGLGHLRDEPIRTLSYGQQKLADLAMVLMPEPAIILLDEPLAGVNPALIEEIVDRLLELNRLGTTMVVIEHNMRVMMRMCQRIVVLDFGKKIAEGTPQDVQADPRVLEAYFGPNPNAEAADGSA